MNNKMKKVILMILAAILGVITANAQFTKGTKTFSIKTNGFDIGVNSQNDNSKYYSYTGFDLNNNGYAYASTRYEGNSENTNTHFNLSITGSSFVSDNLAIEIGLGYSDQRIYWASYNSIDYSIGAKYYFWKNVFGGLSFQGNSAFDWGTLVYSDISFGATFYVTDKVFFEPAVHFKKNLNNDYEYGDKIGLSIGIGRKF
jgi:uncharacterized protein YxeA